MRVSRGSITVVLAAVAALIFGLVAPGEAAPAAAPWTARPATYEVVVEHDVPITMSDGTKLYADVHRPAKDGVAVARRFPVILTQNPYNKSAPLGENPYLVQRGYVHVVVDVRGTGSSQGTWSSFGEREQRDGYELVRWVASKHRAWSDGRVGTYGPSYMGINQIFTAAQRPPGLKAAFPIVPAGDVYRDVVASGGQLDVGFIPLWLGLVTATGLVPPAYTAVDPASGLSTLLQHAGNAASFQGNLLVNSATGGDLAYDGPFYRQRSPLNAIDKVRVPTLFAGGWYDLFQRGTPMLYERLRRNGVPAKLVMGQWTHIGGSMGDGLPSGPVPTYDELALRWFDHYVRGVADPALNTDLAPIAYHELGSNKWRRATRWIGPEVRARALRLDGPSTPGAPGALTSGAPTGTAPDTVWPIPITGLCTRSASQWTAGNPVLDATCAQDQRLDSALGTAYEVAVDKPLQLFGPVAARLFVSTTAHDGMIAARLEDVAPDGSVKQLTAGWQVLSLRALDRSRSVIRDGHVLQPWHQFTRESVLPVNPGEVNEVHVEIFPTGAVVAPGHKLRVSFQAYDTPHLAPPLPQFLNSVGGVMSIHHDPDHPSQLILPVR